MALPESALASIIQSAILAPSGDNAQPWRFRILDNRIQLINRPEADSSFFNYDQASNYIALGAALENMRLAALERGYVPTIAYFPGPDSDTVAELCLTEGGAERDSLCESIPNRASNRKPYDDIPLTSEEYAALRASDQGHAGINLSFVTDKDRVRRIGKLVSAGERVTLENESIHQFLFQHVTWSPADDAQRHGFYIKTFEFKPPQEAAFRLFRNWRILRLFHPLGITRMIARDMAGVYGRSAAFGAISLTRTSPEAFVRAGMLLERVWLTATRLGLGLQMTASIPLLSIRLAHTEEGLSEKHASLVRERADALKDEFSIPRENALVVAFRLGHTAPPSARTSRSEPQVER